MDVIDLDTIDASNLNRQFLFTTADVGQPKSFVAARVLSRHGCIITPHHHNVMDTAKFPKEFFASFEVVCCGLDNVAARKHVNRMCHRAKVPLVESGTTGFNGQVQPITAGTTECYDCAPKSSGVPSFAVCTIHARPTTIIHCVHYAKELYSRLFGDVASGDAELEALEPLRADPMGLFQVIHYDKILAGAAALVGHPRGAPRPISSADVATKNCSEEVSAYAQSFGRFMTSLQGRGQRCAFDKDDDDAVGFVSAVANLRAFIFNIESKSDRDLKTIAGNIIPAVATSNAIIGAMVVAQAVRYLGDSQPLQFVHLRQVPQERRRVVQGKGRVVDKFLIHSHGTTKPVPTCMTCSSSRGHAIVTLDASDTTLGHFVKEVLIKDMGLSAPTVDVPPATILYEHDEFTNLAGEKLMKWITREGRVDLHVTDEAQEVEWTVTLQHVPTAEDQSALFKLVVATQATVREGGHQALQGDKDGDDGLTMYNPRNSKRARGGPSGGRMPEANLVCL